MFIEEKEGEFMEESESYHKITQEADDTYSTDFGWGLYKDDDNSSAKNSKYRRTYTWNERNQLISSVDSSYSTAYVYGQDGQRSNKYTQNSETLYFNKMWTLHTDSGNSVYGGQSAKNIYLGETRIVTKLNGGNSPTYQEEYYKQYFYHSDHLGSASLISDYNGDEYQRIEYTPYGETWVEKTSNTGMEYLPYKFTGKEMDEETGLYYYGARYLDPKYSMWISTDPALGEYIPIAPTNDEAKKHNSNLPGMGGVFNAVNLSLYHYAGNNPIKYTDPNGRFVINLTNEPVLIRTEDKGYVALPAYSVYTGFGVQNSGLDFFFGIDGGKIDGVIFGDGTIYKVSGHKYFPKAISLILGKCEIDGKEMKGAFFANIESLALNCLSDFIKEFLGKDCSGEYKIQDGSKTGDWLEGKIPSETLNEMCKGGKTTFYTKDEIQEIVRKEAEKNAQKN